MDILKRDYITINNDINTEVAFSQQYCVGNIYGHDQPMCGKCKLYLPADLNYYTKTIDNNNSESYDEEDDDDGDNSESDNTNGSSYKNTYNLCQLCYDLTDNKDFVITKLESGLDNIQDWVLIFSTWIQRGSSSQPDKSVDHIDNEFTEYYCNLNPKSIYYKRFAMNYYVDMLGFGFKIIKENSIEDILYTYI